MNPCVSIIVPVYNTASLLPRCLESLLAQTFRDFEILLVDDGSSDGSERICDEYAARDARIRVFHKSNAGVAAARQDALDQASGTYSIHVDSDDWVDPEVLQAMVQRAEADDLDMLITDFYSEYSGRSVLECQDPGTSDREEIQRLMFRSLHGSLSNKLIRTSLYFRFGIRIPSDLQFAEDQLTVIRLFCHPLKVGYLPVAFFHYDRFSSEHSLTRDQTRKLIDNQYRFLNLLRDSIDLEQLGCHYYGLMVFYAFLNLYKGSLSRQEYLARYQGYRREMLRGTAPLWERLPVYAALSLNYTFGRCMCRLFGKFKFTLTRLIAVR
jgi:glycosyltransferase involved in cell wall biosynthesis